MTNNETITTEITKLFHIKYPIILAGMNVASGPDLAAAVTNAGGLGVVGGLGYTPDFMKTQIDKLKEGLIDKNAPFGIDLALPQVGGSARKTNYDYTDGQLPQLIDVIIQGGAKLFVSAVGVPPKWAVDKLHAAGIVCANMVGAPKHAIKAINAGMDIIIAQGTEGGGHTGEIATSVLIPKVVDVCKGYKSAFTGKPIYVVAAGGIYCGRSLAMALSLGAEGVWVGTRFICTTESGASKRHQQAIIKADFSDTIATLIYSGRPLRTLKTDYVRDWEENKQQLIRELTGRGELPFKWDMVSFFFYSLFSLSLDFFSLSRPSSSSSSSSSLYRREERKRASLSPSRRLSNFNLS